ncbi:uncharacterized protein LOC122059954 [Macadamia integrifolia]|uniref:uncharacterized protein LOC122059954 n=1 Tax=Macadamia integrifolia TaxID=60698 RepID=UPI001C52CDD0|nr:uncharacterized protein LOC122059954 [Macadamia integrifolia]XP_042478987.1 uncharacterized protein LOC122059954 [Macadamia integrifolia]
MDILEENILRLWIEWELRALVLASLFTQILLISSATIRKYTASRKIGFLIWSCYLLADWVATLALGVLAKSLMNNCEGGFQNQPGSSKNDADELKAIWAPFLLLHLGGPDNITAFSLEDNELWLRHFLGLLFQVGTAFYIFIMSSLAEAKLRVITILMFTGGIIKYVEKTLALMNASRDNFRKSMVTDPDPGPDYAGFMEKYARHKNAGLKPNIGILVEPSKPITIKDEVLEIELILRAHYLFRMLKRIMVDLILTYQDRNDSQSCFRGKSWDEAFKLIEIELGFLYEILYTKASVVYTLKGWILRFISVSSIIAVSIIFFAFTDQKQRYHKIDVTITYVLLSGAIALELWSLTRLLFTDWTVVWMMKKENLNRLARFLFKAISHVMPPNQSRWSNSMAQYNLIEFCLKDQPFFWGKVMELIRVKDLFDNHWHRTYKNISKDLKKFIYEYLEHNLETERSDPALSHQELRTSRGQLALQMTNADEILHNSIKAEFDESILLWHIATDFCYYLDMEGEKNQSETVLSNQRRSRDISNYMLYLLISRPFMLTAGIGQIRFGDTCAEAKRFFNHRKKEIGTNEKEACIRLHKVDTEIPPAQLKGDRSKSVLFDASRVAKSLLEKEPDIEKRWDIISHVWLEMLCYAASECRGYYHAQRLSAGGELLTIVCFLMAHLGIGEQYRVNQGRIQAKLFVDTPNVNV